MRILDAAEIRARLTYDVCIPAVRAAMMEVSAGSTRQLLRSILPLADGKLLGVMPGALAPGDVFGAKLVSVSHGAGGRPSHQGVVVLFDGDTGAPVCIADGGEITAIRTAAASAVATEALARPDAAHLAVLGAGVQAQAHARAIAHVRRLATITLWDVDAARAGGLAQSLMRELGVPVNAAETARLAVARADIICTVTPAQDPILFADWVAPGAHLNVVGSSVAGPAEVDGALVRRARFIADSRAGVLAQGGEFLRAKAAGLVSDDHVVGEIGDVLSGALTGRENDQQLTLYKSLGHIAQDLAAARALLLPQA